MALLGPRAKNGEIYFHKKISANNHEGKIIRPMIFCLKSDFMNFFARETNNANALWRAL